MRFTKDRAIVQDRSLVHTEHPLGENQSITREGFLLCRNVPIARTGLQEYLNDEICEENDTDNELHGARGKNGIVQVERLEEDVFHPDCLASFEGKDVVDDHPDDPVTPDNYHEHTVGVTLNPRRGEGGLSDFIIADLLIKKASAIAAVRAGKREVSAGYDADYKVLGPGRARQHNIIANHVALVDRGRCGFRCAIGDKEPDMSKKTIDKKPGLVRRVLDALANKDRKALESAMDDMEKEEDEEASEKETMNATGTHIHVHLGGKEEAKGADPATAGAAKDDEEEVVEEEAEGAAANGLEKRVLALETGQQQILESLRKIATRLGDGEEEEVVEEAEEGQGEEEAEGEVADADEEEEKAEEKKDPKAKDKTKDSKRVKDSASLKDVHRDTVSDAEVLSPGLKMPTFDSAKPFTVTRDSICLLKRRSLALAARDDKNGGADAVKTMLGKGKTLTGLDCNVVDTVFNGAVALMKDRNTQDDAPKTISQARGTKTRDQKAPTSIADMNRMNREANKQPVK